jgi:ATP synthase protein I
MGQGDKDDALRNLQERLDKARHAAGLPTDGAPHSSGAPVPGNALAVGFRIGVELVVAVFVGVGLGWAFDNWLGTKPWGFIFFLFLGFGAGVANVFRIALGNQRAVGYAPPKSGTQEPVNWSDDED